MAKGVSYCILCLLLLGAIAYSQDFQPLKELPEEEILHQNQQSLRQDPGPLRDKIETEGCPIDDNRGSSPPRQVPLLQTIIQITVQPVNESHVRSGTNISVLLSSLAAFLWYSWDSGAETYVETPTLPYGIIVPSGAGWKDLDLWANSTVSPYEVTHEYYRFFADNTLELPVLNSPANESKVPSWTPLDFTYPEPLTSHFSWDGSPLNGTAVVPAGNGAHTLELDVTDAAGNTANLTYVFVATLNLRLVSLVNNSVVQGGAAIELELSAEGNILYSWDAIVNTTYSAFPAKTPDAEGWHILDAYGENATGYIVHRKYNFTTDNSVPTLTITSGHADDDELVPGETLIIGYIELLQEISISWREHSQYSYYSDTPPADEVYWPVPNPGGLHHLDLFARDVAGNTFSVTYTFHVLILPSLVGIANNSIIEPETQINLTFTDDFGIASSMYKWDTGLNSTYRKPVPYGSGWHNLTVYSQNQEMRWLKTVFGFKVLIALRDMSPTPNKRIQDNTPLSLTWSDAPLTTEFSWDGATNVSSFPTLTGAEGPHSLAIWAEGNLGLWNYFLFNWTIDMTPLVVLLADGVANNSAYLAGQSVNFTVDDPPDLDYAEISWDGGSKTQLEAPSLATTIPYSPSGWHILEVWAYDEAQNEGYAKFRFSSLVTLLAISPANGSYIQSSATTSLPTSAAPVVATYEWNNSGAQGVLGPIPTTDGSYILRIGYQAASGHWNNYTLVYHVDNRVPCPILQGVHGALYNGSPVRSNYLLNVSWADEQEPLSMIWCWDQGTNTTILQPTPATAGPHSLSWWLVDAAGNANYSTFNVIVDTKAIADLQLAAGSPASGSDIQGGVLIVLAAGETPYVGLWQWDTLNATTGWPNTTAPLDEGNHTVTVSIADEAGWWTNQTFWWVVDNTAPMVIATPALAELALTPIRNGTVINVTIDSGVLKYAWNDGANISAKAPHQDQVLLTIAFPDGSRQLTLYATDPAGNTNTTSILLTVDSTPIDLRITYPQDGATKYYTIWATVEFSEMPYSYTAEWAGKAAKTYWEANTTLKAKCVKDKGRHELIITATDEAGNLATESIAIQMEDDPLPLYLMVTGGATLVVVGIPVGILVWKKREAIISRVKAKLPKRASEADE